MPSFVKTRVRTKPDWDRIRRERYHGSIRSLGHAGQEVRRLSRKKIKTSKKKHAPKGQPPRTRRGQLKKAILYDVDKSSESVIIGPSTHLISKIGAAHEHGLTEKPKRRAKPPDANWKLEIGGHGPIPADDRRGSVYIRIRTKRQLRRVKRWAGSRGKTNRRFANVRKQPKPVGKARKYPKRPFMGPTLEEITPRLSKFWSGSVS